jgi:hypothetical protein
LFEPRADIEPALIAHDLADFVDAKALELDLSGHGGAKVWGYDSVMETFVLIALVWTGAGIGVREVRTPDLPELQCKLMKLQHDSARLGPRAWCAIQGRPEPVWSPSPYTPTRECAACGEIPGRKPA